MIVSFRTKKKNELSSKCSGIGWIQLGVYIEGINSIYAYIIFNVLKVCMYVCIYHNGMHLSFWNLENYICGKIFGKATIVLVLILQLDLSLVNFFSWKLGGYILYKPICHLLSGALWILYTVFYLSSVIW